MAADLIYVEVAGTNCILDGKRGIVTSIHYSPIDHSVDGAFVGWDDGGTAYVTTGRHAGEKRSGGHWTHREVESVRDIDREEFDVLSGLASIRKELGWRG
jgi:hypothetical protein